MNIALTYKCNEGCSHCFENAKPDEIEMNVVTLNNTVKFLKKANPLIISISGGEFTLHSNFFDFSATIIREMPNSKIMLLSNGSFINDGLKRNKIISLIRKRNVHGLQIVTDKKYYPNYETTMKNKPMFEMLGKNVFVCEGVASLINLGRAMENKLETNKERSAMCSNMMLVSKQVDSFPQLISTLQSAGKFCCPHIDPEGNLHLGETRYCRIFGNVNDNFGGLFNKIRSYNDVCGTCGNKINYNKLKTIAN